MPEFVGEWVDFAKNIEALAGHLDACVRVLEDKRARIESGPNHPDLKANDLAAIDRELAPLRFKAQAAYEGAYFYDPRELSGLDPNHQRWVAMARKAGSLVTPDTFEPSLHAQEEDKATPLRVIRGGRESGQGGFDMGNPSFSTAGR